jgi:hypothetical protein
MEGRETGGAPDKRGKNWRAAGAMGSTLPIGAVRCRKNFAPFGAEIKLD